MHSGAANRRQPRCTANEHRHAGSLLYSVKLLCSVDRGSHTFASHTFSHLHTCTLTLAVVAEVLVVSIQVLALKGSGHAGHERRLALDLKGLREGRGDKL